MTPTADIHARRELLRRRFAVWQPRTLSDWLDDCAERYRDRPMVLTDDRTLTYANIAAESRRLSDGLAALRVKPGDRVAMVMANYPEFVAIKFGIARAGAIAVPLNYLYRSDELHFVLTDSGCRVVVTMTGFRDLRLSGDAGRHARPADDGIARYRRPGASRCAFGRRPGRAGRPQRRRQ